MKKIKDFLTQKHRWVKLIVIADVMILLVAIVLYIHHVNHLISYHFDSDQLAAFTADEYEDCFGGAIDENSEPGWYDITPDLFFRKGFYRYSVSYISTAPGSCVWPYVDADHINMMDVAMIYFEDGAHTNTEELWLNADLHTVLKLNFPSTGSVTITDFSMEETSYAARIKLFYTIFILLAANFIIVAYVHQKEHVVAKYKKYIFAGLLTVTVFASYPLLVDYAIEGHDLYFHLIRIEGIKDGLQSGQFPVRINPTFYNGYGYANPVFYGELFLYIPAFLRLVGFPLTTCYNIYAILVNLFTCFGGYYCFKRIFNSPAAGLAVTLLYTMAPYRLMDMYLRVAVGEYTAMAFLPFVAYGLYRIYTEDAEQKKYRRCFLPLVIGLTGILQTHVLTSEMIGGIILLVCLLLLPLTLQKKRFLALIKAAAVTVGINLWFIVPFADYTLTQNVKIFVSSDRALIQNTGTFITQLLSLFQEYTMSVSMPANRGLTYEMPLTLGMPLVLGMILCLTMLCRRGEKHPQKAQAAFWLVLTILVIWMSTIYFPWDKLAMEIPVLRNIITSIQYVWRFLAPGTVLAAIVTGFGLLLLHSKEGKEVCVLAGLLLCTLTAVSGMQFMQTAVYEREALRLNSANELDTGAMGGEYLLSEADDRIMAEILEPEMYNGILSYYEKKGTTVTFYVEGAEEECYILLPMLNYRGYYVKSENNLVTNQNLSSGEHDEIRIDLPAGFSGLVKVYFREPWYWRLSEIVSAVCFILLIALNSRDRIKNKFNC